MIIGIVLIVLVGRAFYQLAHEYDKSRWGYAIAGVASYYIGLFTSAFIVGIVIELISPGTITESNENMFGLLAIPFGALVCWGFYTWLKRSWERARSAEALNTLDTLDGEMINNDHTPNTDTV